MLEEVDERAALLQRTCENTTANPGVRALLEETGEPEPFDVGLGAETRDELCLAMVGNIVDR